MRTFLLLILWAAIATVAQAMPDGSLVPLPVSQTFSSSAAEASFRLTSDTKVRYADKELETTARLLAANLSEQIDWQLEVERQTSKKGNFIFLQVNPQDTCLLEAHCTYGVSARTSVPADERYTLRVTTEGITIVGASVEGVSCGCATLRQLIGTATAPVPCQAVKDAPLYAWRGLSLDVARSFREVDEVKCVIEMMSLYKLNVLHLHLSDHQGWRIEIKARPELALKGGFVENNGRKGGFYTQSQYKELVAYAAARNVTIVPELDLPGHSEAVFKAYPAYSNAAHLPFEFNFPGQAPVSIDPDDEAAMATVKAAFSELAALTPARFIHIGGDETFGMDEEKYTRFVKEIRAYVRSLGKEVVGWQEMARADVGSGDILQHRISFSKKQLANRAKVSGQSSNALNIPEEVKNMLGATYMKAPNDLPTGVSCGAKILLSPSAFVYMDCPYEEESIDTLQRAERQRLGLQAYTPQTLQDVYEWNPKTYHPKLDWQTDIAGVEGAIWSETIESFRDMQFLLLPRLCGVAEKAWTDAERTDWQSYRLRLSRQAALWEHYDWNYFKSSLIDWDGCHATGIIPDTRHRVIVLTDVENEPDDTESLVRLMLYSNQMDLRGIIATTSTHMRHRIAPETIHSVIDAYASVRPNLLLHEDGYPHPDSLHALVKSALPRYGMNGVGDGMDSEGSEWIVRELCRADSRPLWITVWGGVNPLAQALRKMRLTLSEEELNRALAKLRVYTISDQDDAGAWIRREFPSLFYIVSPGSYSRATWTGIASTEDSLSDPRTVSAGWIAENIQQGHGPLGAAYPDVAYLMEGDTPSFLGLIPNGLNCMEHPDWGGWGGRYELYIPREEEYMGEADSSNGYVPIERETRPIWTNAEDTYTAPDGRTSTGIRETIYRWRTDFQNDFAARMDWCVKPYAEANHAPVPVAVMKTRIPPYTSDNALPVEIPDFRVKSGEHFMLDAHGSYDPDGDNLSYLWFCYPEAGSYKGNVEVLGSPRIVHTTVKAPVVDKEETIHFILKVTDKGTPALTRYKRVIITVYP